MSASISVTLQVRVTTQKGDKVAVSGAHELLGAWNTEKVKFLKPKATLHDRDVWFITISVPLSCEELEYRYLICRKFNGDDGDLETYIIRHWEAGIYPRRSTISELSVNQSVDTYGVFEPHRKMFVDQGWLISETEVQLRFYKDPIHLFKKRNRASTYKVKCSAVNLYQDDFPNRNSSYDGTDEYFNRVIHSSNPLIRVTSLGKYKNKEQSSEGMPVSSTDYVIYKLRTLDLESHGIKVDFYKHSDSSDDLSIFLGYTNLLPLHLESGSGSVVLAVNGSHGFPIGQVTVRYLVCKPCRHQKYNLRHSFTKWWRRDRPTLEIGHRGLGDTHASDINSVHELEKDIKHENTIGSLVTAAESGADFVEFDVMLSKDKIPIIWHDFKVSILLRKRTRGHHRVHHIPVHELTLSQLHDLRVEFAKENSEAEYQDLLDASDEVIYRNELSPFPTLEHALGVIDHHVGFYVELKYPQIVYGSKQMEENLESYFERNHFLDPILKVLNHHAGNRRIVLASFDPDICIMARLKQNRYPVILLIEDLGPQWPYYHDIRTHKISTAVSVANSEHFLGLSVNAAALLRQDNALEHVLSENMVCFVWGSEANDSGVREELKSRKVHAICHDEISKKKTISVYRAEHEERLSKVCQQYSSGISPVASHSGSTTDSLSDLPSNLAAQVQGHDLTQISKLRYSISPHTENSLTAIDSEIVPVVKVTSDSSVDRDISNSSVNKMVGVNMSNTDLVIDEPPNGASQGNDYTTDFY